MDLDFDIREYTAAQFDSINFNELNDRWIDDVIDNDFVDIEENTMTTSILFVNDALPTLFRLSEVCNSWYQRSHDDDNSSSDSYSSTLENEVLWTYLDELGISVKKLLGMIYLLCYQASKQASTFKVKQLGLGSAKWYFSCLRVPGSTAYSVFHPNLFKLCLDCMFVPDLVAENKNSDSWKDFEKLLPLSVSTLESLLPLLSTFHLGDDPTVEYVIKTLVDMVGSEISTKLDFDLNFMVMSAKERKRYRESFQVASLSFQGLSMLITSDINGKMDYNYPVILSYLNRHIMCSKVKKCPAIPHKFIVIKENAVNYICYNLNTDQNLYSKLTQTALKRLCLSVCDKTEFRYTVSLAVFTVMHHLSIEHLADMIKWLLMLVDSCDLKDRVFTLDVLGHMLSGVQKHDVEQLPSKLKAYFTEVPIIFSVLTRCDDISPVVKTKALGVLSQNMECILKFLEKTKDETTFTYEEDEAPYARDKEISGDHRTFWYNLKSYKERLNELASLLHRRVEDNNVNARKAALQALENLIVFDAAYLRDDHLKLFIPAARDNNVIVRKQMIMSLTTILDTYYEKPLAYEYWLKCVLPLIHDPENSVESKALSVMEDNFLHKIFSSKQAEQDCVFELLSALSGKLLSHQKYLQKAFSIWKKEDKLRSQMIVHLEKHFEAKSDCVWFYLSIFASYCKLPIKMCIFTMEQFKKYQSSETYPACMEYIIKVLGSQCSDLPKEKLQDIHNALKEQLMSCSIPVEFILPNVNILYKIQQQLKTEIELSAFSIEIVKRCVASMTLLFKKGCAKEPPSELMIAKCLCTMKEFCQICPTSITQNNIKILKALSGHGKALCKFSPVIQAHAVAALGKICLHDELLAKELLPSFATELISSKRSVIRSNLVVIMVEMCKRYTSFADKYVPLISQCFKDKLYIIRFQAVSLLIGLLQEEYIKWRGCLFFCLLSTLLDNNKSIKELGQYCLIQLEEKNDKKRKSVFADHFVDSIFVFNYYIPPDNEKLSQTVREMETFSLQGEGNYENRMELYNFMLEYMPVSNCVFLVRQLCEEILTSIADTVFPLRDETECMVRDCFGILSSKAIRSYTADNEIEEDVEERIVLLELEARRLIFVTPVIPVIISLKNCVTSNRSKLLTDIIEFLKEILQDFKPEVDKLLAGDKMLLRQVQLEIRNEMMQLEKEAKEKSKKNCGDPSEIAGPLCGTQITERAKDISNYLWQKEKIPENTITRKSSQNTVSSTRKMRSSQRQGAQEMDTESINNHCIPLESSAPNRRRSRQVSGEVNLETPENSIDLPSKTTRKRSKANHSQDNCEEGDVKSTTENVCENMSISEEEELIRIAKSSKPQVLLTAIKLPFVPNANCINSVNLKSLNLSDTD